jgi:iron complex outermembrane receptor protein
MQEKWNKLFEGYLNYTKTIDMLGLDLMAGYSWQSFREYSPISTLPNDFTGGFPSSFYNGYTFYGNPNTSPPYYTNLPADNRLNLQSFYGRAILSFWNKYILTGTIRRDGSSRFYNGTLNNVWGNFPTASLAWKIKQESFLKDVDAVSDLKIRLGWGQTGNQNIGGYYLSYAAYNKSDNGSQYQFGNSYYNMWKPTQYNPVLTWETTTSENIGLDYGFWNDRIYGSLDYYQKQGKDMLMDVNVPPDNSFANHNNKNVGQIDTKGFEASFNIVPLKTKTTKWELNLNASTYNTNVKSIKGQADNYVMQVGGIAGGTGNMIGGLTVGQPRGAFWVYEQVYDKNGKPLNGVYVDRNGDGKIDDADRYFISSEPKLTLGFSTTLNVNRWDFGFSCRTVLGNKVYNNFAGGSSIAQYNSFLNNVSGVSADYAFTTPQYWSDIFIENASFFRMDNMTAGYNFGRVFKGISNIRAYIQAQNVFVLTGYKGVDPEIPSLDSNGAMSGVIDNNFYPRPRVYLIGFNIQF